MLDPSCFMRENSLLVAINSGYVHSNLAVRMLSRAGDVPFAEFNINMQKRDVLARLVGRSIYFFSCYIWNHTYVLDLIDDLRAIDNKAIIVLGGPSVSFGAKELLAKNPAIDYILTGEGEETLPLLLECIDNHREPNFPGAVFTKDGAVAGDDSYRLTQKLTCLPYGGDIVYFETSRGCPFSCTYCLSGYLKGVRYYDMEDVKNSLTELATLGVRVVKFVDRTFNANKARAKEILRHLLTLQCDTIWHFEIGGDLLDDETIDLLNKGKFQVEIGIQSTNEETLAAVRRSCNLKTLSDNVRRLSIHKHVDLIAGLPFEDLSSFIRSFNQVYALDADMLQLGFLKVLPGSPLEDDARIIHSHQPPYTVMKTDWLSYDDIAQLERVEKALDVYTADCRFVHSLKLLEEHCDHPYALFLRLAEGFGDKIYAPIGYTKAMENMYNSFKDETYANTLLWLMHCDYHLSGAKGKAPACLPYIEYVAKEVRRELGLDKDRKFFVTGIDFKTRTLGPYAVVDGKQIIPLKEEL